ncbi:MAG TPA: hypothetical protein VF733_05385 [Candidatus Saccharimonadales bacterium]
MSSNNSGKPPTEIDPSILETPDTFKLSGPIWDSVYRSDTIGKKRIGTDAETTRLAAGISNSGGLFGSA